MITGLLYVSPFLVLIALLMFGLYPGEALLLRITADAGPTRRRAPGRLRVPRAREVITPRGGALLAASLAGRAPPL